MMPVTNLLELPGSITAGVLSAAMIPLASAPGTLPPCYFVTDCWIANQPSGSADSLKYWMGFSPLSSYENAAVPTVMCGSGSDSVLARLIKIEDHDSEQNDVIVPLSNNEAIAGIRSALSLQIKELAEILQVQRPTIYSWIKDEVEPSAANRARLQQIYRIASQWTRRCKLPAERLLRTAGTDGFSVLDLLKADDIDETAIVSRLETLAKERQRIKAEANRARPTSAALARRHGLASNDISDQQHLIDAETGKRWHND